MRPDARLLTYCRREVSVSFGIESVAQVIAEYIVQNVILANERTYRHRTHLFRYDMTKQMSETNIHRKFLESIPSEILFFDPENSCLQEYLQEYLPFLFSSLISVAMEGNMYFLDEQAKQIIIGLKQVLKDKENMYHIEEN